MLDLTRDNYYSTEADWAYMSCSQYQSFCQCEAKQMAKLQGRWEDKPSEALVVGNYFHTFFESEEAHEEFIREHEAEIFLKQTKADKEAGILRKRAPYEQADRMINTALKDELIASFIHMDGENEKIMHGTLFGVPWRIRVDKYIQEGRIILDWKTCASITELKWNDKLHEKATFIDNYEYMMRAAVYSEIEKQFMGKDTDANFIIVAISKQDYPDKEVLSLNHRQRYDYELEQIKGRLQHIVMVKEGRRRPVRCGYCDYCRATKKLYAIKPYYTLMPEFREPREEDFDAGTMLDNTPEAGNMESVPSVQEIAALGQD